MITPTVMALVWLGHASVAFALPFLAWHGGWPEAGRDAANDPRDRSEA
jgi:hypothetical protein